MSEKHSNIKRIVHRCIEELKATNKIAKVVSLNGAIATLIAKADIQIINRKGYYESQKVKSRLIKKHKVMLEYYTKTFNKFLNEYQYNYEISPENKNMDDTIWVCWWQGLDNAPEIVKKCIESIKRNAGNRRVILLTDENYKQYVNIPYWVEEKRKKGIITRTNYSDLLRLSLLAEHGGMWLDATFYCAKQLPQEYFELPIWSIKRPNYAHASVAGGYFAGYSLACKSECRWVFATIRDFFLNYWENNDTMIDYLMVDYMIVLAQKHNKQIDDLFNSIPANNPNCDELFKVLNEPFDCEKWECLKENTSLFKLTWKQEFKKEVNGQKTFYGKLVECSLD